MTIKSPSIVEKGQSSPYTEVAHLKRPKHRGATRSRLPGPLWLLTFAPKWPSPFLDFKGSISHPFTLYFFGVSTALVAGVGVIIFDLIYGIFTTRITNSNASSSALYDAGQFTGWVMCIVAVVTLICFVVFLGTCSLAGLKIANELRTAYFESILSQDCSFFDHVGAGEVASRSAKDINSIRIAAGEKVGYITMNLALIIAALISSLIQSPKLAGILFSLIPFTFIILGVIGWWSQKKTAASDSLEASTSTSVEQVISAARIVQSFGIGDRLMAKLELEAFRPLRRLGVTRAIGKSLEQTAAFFVIFVAYSLAFYAGSIVVAEGTDIGHVLTALYNVINLLFGFAMSIPHISAILEAMTVLKAIRRQIERDPLIDITDEGGLTLQATDHWQPSFKLENVTFAYPSRGHIKALDDISLDFPPGTFTAVCGPSGSGKSTVASLLLREYDPETANMPREIDTEIKRHFEETPEDAKETKKGNKRMQVDKEGEKEGPSEIEPDPERPFVKGSGRITFAGHDVRELNLRWMRRQIAVVSQNPQLFAGTILDNVASGLTGSGLEYKPDDMPQTEKAGSSNLLNEIRERCEEALRQSQAWEFVEELPEGMDTVILGGRTGVLSGGQLQRVALARALVSRPRCLLLDEATSAVASDAEIRIMDVLLQMQKTRGLTLIVIAHRLSSIASADSIIVMKQGQFVSQGTYEELADPENPEPTFRNMVNVAIGSPASASDRQCDSYDSSPTLRKRQTSQRTLANPPATARAIEVLGPALKRSKSVFRLNKWLLLFGTLASMIGGASFAASGLLTGYAVSSLSIPDDDARMRREMNRWALWFLVVAIGDLIFFFMAGFNLEFAGTEIKTTLTKESLRAVLRQDTEFFESSAGGSGTLTSGIAEFPGAVGNTVGVIWLQIVVALSNLAASFILGFVLSWRVAIIGIPAIVLCIIAGYFNFTWLERFEAMVTKESEKRSNFINESVNSIRTIAALTREGETLRRFKASAETPHRQRLALLLGSVGFGVSQGVVFLFGAFVFWWGGRLVSRNEISIKDLFAVSEAVLLATMTSGRILTFVGDVSRTSNALKSIQKWLDLEPAHIKASDAARKEAGADEPLLPDGSMIQFHNVELRYPSRPDALALDNVSLTFRPGLTYAFCGPSGSGKSSILALLQRFYEPTAGKITIGGVDIRAIEMQTARGMMGYVSQEAVLFQGSIRFNLCLGAKNPDEVSQEQMEEACKQASILDFIQGLENGFDTDLGMKGNQLSGGQKQRLCIARALLSGPRILLLDEATSALDNESQAIIQQALDKISAAPDGPTIITVAHRLSTIRNADVILVMDKGAVVEKGSHYELVQAKGRYWDLIQGQL